MRPQPFTTTVPVMNGWIAQWYAYVPAVRNVNENAPPGESVPLANAPALDVTVCCTWPAFFHVTVVPTVTETEDGLNPKSMMFARS